MAAKELLRRMDATERLIAFTEYTNSGYTPAPHHRRIADKLEAVERGEIDRLMIFMPPRHGKSELASRRFPAWYLGRNPNRQIIAASYNSDLANDFGREVRNIVDGPEYGCVFNTRLRDDSRAADRWNTDSGGAYVAAGVGTAVTGRGAHILLIDDPLKDREEADSEIRRQRVWDWYTSTAYTRLMPGGAVILIQTRWHEDDLAGRLIESSKTGGDKWDVLDLPAMDDRGNALWPEWYGVKTLERIRAAIGPRDWSALYQQRPAPEEGDYFKADWFRSYTTAPDPKTLRIYGGSDYAVTADGGDYTCHVVVGLDPEGRMYLLDLWRKQAASDEWIEAFCDLVKKWKPIGWAEEQGQIRAGIGPFLDRRSRERAAFVARDQFPTRGDKAVRAQSIRGRMALGGLYVPTGSDWFPQFRTELLSFPAGKHDDQVDALGLVGQLLDKMLSGSKPVQPDKPKNPSGYRALVTAAEPDDWKAAI
jgi:predicted phage terminase large subunit-like protein